MAGATVAVVGAGGLGGPIALALAEAGCRVVIFDDDRVELSNLHRQVHFTLADLGRSKAEVVAARAHGRALTARFTPEVELTCDAIVDGSDDPPTKFAVAAWARARRRPYVIAAALRYGGNVFAAGPDDACYACLFEDPPTDAATCGEAGVLGPVVGWVGGVAAQATLALLGGARGASIWVLDDLRRGAARTVALARRADCAACEAR
jgi:molybdopterin/thiamine biosynthesis adenylyltransferase